MSPPDYLNNIKDFLSDYGIASSPDAAIVLGSGLGDFTAHIENATTVPYTKVPYFPVTSVAGHAGALVSGEIDGRPVLGFSGRFHYYEGCTIEQTALPVHVASALDAEKLILSNAAGAVNTSFQVGDLMVIEDVMRQNLAISPRRRGRKPFRYTHYHHVQRVRELASRLDIATQKGSYLYVTGPSYETKAEIRSFRTMGADAVGMSTAPELMEAARLGIKTVAISLITNMAAGITPGKLSHDEVSKTGASRKDDFEKLVKMLITDW